MIRRFLQHPLPWSLLLLSWAAALVFFSSQEAGTLPSVAIRHGDKIAHFGYFAAGGFVLAGLLYTYRLKRIRWRWIFLVCCLVAAAVGWLDEWHQSFVAGRSGNDFGDWLADVLGGTAGSLIARGMLGGRDRRGSEVDLDA